MEGGLEDELDIQLVQKQVVDCIGKGGGTIDQVPEGWRLLQLMSITRIYYFIESSQFGSANQNFLGHV